MPVTKGRSFIYIQASKIFIIQIKHHYNYNYTNSYSYAVRTIEIMFIIVTESPSEIQSLVYQPKVQSAVVRLIFAWIINFIGIKIHVSNAEILRN